MQVLPTIAEFREFWKKGLRDERSRSFNFGQAVLNPGGGGEPAAVRFLGLELALRGQVA